MGASSFLLGISGVPGTVRVDNVGAAQVRVLETLNVTATPVAGEAPEADYRVRVTAVRPASPAAAGRPGPPRRFVRFLPGEDEDRVVLPGGTLRIAPGRPSARIILRARGSSWDVALQSEVLETALIHAAALQARATVHAAAFRFAGARVLATGATRAGKSTLAAAVLRCGGRIVSDDSLLVGFEHGTPVARALRRDLWLRDGSVHLLPGAGAGAPRGVGARGEERWLFERAGHEASFVDSLEPAVVVHLVRDRRLAGFRLRRLTAAESMARLLTATSPLFLAPRYAAERSRLLPVLTGLVNHAPGFELRMGRGLLTDPAAVLERLAADLSAARRP